MSFYMFLQVNSQVLPAESLPPVRSLCTKLNPSTLISKQRNAAWTTPFLTVSLISFRMIYCKTFIAGLNTFSLSILSFTTFHFCLCVAPSAASPCGVGKEGVSASGLRKAGQRKAPGGGGLKALGAEHPPPHTLRLFISLLPKSLSVKTLYIVLDICLYLCCSSVKCCSTNPDPVLKRTGSHWTESMF